MGLRTTSTPAAGPATSPVATSDRIWAIDALRGFALFGVLAINLHTEFRVSLFEQFLAPPAMGRTDRVAAAFLSFAFEFKAISLFSLLFGVGLAIQHERLARNPRRALLLVRRLLALLLFGLIHLFLIWNGDILTEYALAGFVVLPLLFAPAGMSLIAAAALLLAYVMLAFVPLPFSFPDAAWLNDHVTMARHVYSGGSFVGILRFRIAELPEIAKLLAYIFPRTLALILFGAWLWRSGAIRKLAEHKRALLGGGLMLVGSGVLLTAQDKGYVALIRIGPLSGFGARFAYGALDDLAPILVAFGYAALMLLASGFPTARAALQWAVPVGRTAFSNYILQSVILGLLFYGYGLGLMGRIGPAAGLAIACAIYAAQAWLSAFWLRRHRFGPLEWLWRSLMYGKAQPWLRPITDQG